MDQLLGDRNKPMVEPVSSREVLDGKKQFLALVHSIISLDMDPDLTLVGGEEYSEEARKADDLVDVMRPVRVDGMKCIHRFVYKQAAYRCDPVGTYNRQPGSVLPGDCYEPLMYVFRTACSLWPDGREVKVVDRYMFSYPRYNVMITVADHPVQHPQTRLHKLYLLHTYFDLESLRFPYNYGASDCIGHISQDLLDKVEKVALLGYMENFTGPRKAEDDRYFSDLARKKRHTCGFSLKRKEVMTRDRADLFSLMYPSILRYVKEEHKICISAAVPFMKAESLVSGMLVHYRIALWADKSHGGHLRNKLHYATVTLWHTSWTGTCRVNDFKFESSACELF